MSNRVFQTVIYQIKDVVNRVVGVIDENSIVVACSDASKIGESKQRIREELAYSSDSVISEGFTYRFVSEGTKNDSIAFVEGEDEHAKKTLDLISIFLGNMKNLYDEKYDKTSFIKSILLDNILASDIYIKSNELRFSNDDRRAVIMIKFGQVTEIPPYEMLQEIVGSSDSDYVINISEQDVVLVKEFAKGIDIDEVEVYGKKLLDDVQAKYNEKALVGISSIVESLKDLARGYKEARIAIEVGKVFDIEKPVMSYKKLGIGRLIYQLPTTLCEIFLGEVFKKGSLESLDRETLMTVQAFFENNLNVSETSRKLFVHRNTLVYRLEKIRKVTGLDLREFEHAVTFKVALMVKKYLQSKPAKF